ncbi:MAG: PKD domain-containing protein [Fibrobacteria bacterium]|nr:PKD domain-containing protein [Fibrobacteria bacterium]
MNKLKSIVLVIFSLVAFSLKAQGQIIINEIRPADETSDYCSFVELRNIGTSNQSLNGWAIKYTPSNGLLFPDLAMENLGATGYFPIPSNVSLEPGEIAVFYFGCSGTNTSHTQYVPDMNPIPPYCITSIYSRLPKDNGGYWYGTSLVDYVRFGPGKNPPREVVWDKDKSSSNIWVARHSSGILIDIGAVYNQWPDTNSYVDTKGLPQHASLSHDGTDSNTPEDWEFSPATPGEANSDVGQPLSPSIPPAPLENNSLPALVLKDTRPILYAASFNYQQQGDYPRDWYYHLLRSDVIDPTYNSASTILGSFAVNHETGERGLWVTPASYAVVNTNMAAAVFGEADWTDYRLTCTIKETTGDCNRHQMAEFYLRLVDDVNRVEGYQFNFAGGTSISVRHTMLCHGADIGVVNIHPGVDFWGAGQEWNVFKQLVKDNGGYTDDCNALPENAAMPDPCKNKIYVSVESKGDKISATYDNLKGGRLTMSAIDTTYKSGKIGIGLVYGNYIFNDILVEDLRDNPTGNLPVAIVSPLEGIVNINTPVRFSAENSIYSDDQSKLSYLWDFGDGLQGSGQRPSHSFAGIGTYRVTCTISDGVNQNTDGMFVTVTGPNDNTPPTQVANLQAATQNDAVSLSWDSAADTESGISGYIIYRGTNANPAIPLITIRNITTFKDVTGIANTTFHYRVKAVNGIKVSSASFSNSVNATTSEISSVLSHNLPKAEFNVIHTPFSRVKDLNFYSPLTQSIELKICSSFGRLITTLFKGRIEKGRHSWKWEAPDGKPGIYFAQIKAKNGIMTEKIILLNK